MTDLSERTDWIGDVFTSDAGWALLEDLVDVGNRMAGQRGEREGLERVRDALAAAGCRNTHIDEFDLQGWERGDAGVRAAGRDERCIALPRSPAGEVTAEFVDLGHGVPADFEEGDIEGNVVMMSSDTPDDVDRFIHRTEKYYYAVEHGAAAFVFRNHVEGCLPPTGSVGTDDAPIGDIPAVGVSAEVGARLARRAAGDSVTVDVDCETPEATSGNAMAELGPDTEEEVLVSSHVDAHDIAEGAMDNGAGTATIVEVANALAAVEDLLDTRVRFVAYGAEEVGLVGSGIEAERADRDAIEAVVNVDSNVFGRTLSLSTHGFDDLTAAADRLADRFDHPISTSEEQVPHSDHWPFVIHGVPGYMVAGETEGRGRGWGHTEADTLEKLAVRNLREQAILLTALVADLADADTAVAHRDPSEIAAALEAEDKATGMKVIGDWPYDDDGAVTE
ncbi:M28 family peptidase [Halobaculum gomorrense]|uniref:Carboxypeptidase Q n=1 Tax=Halobaculum gomorrense TaxID=43928 RepID=A0A1M5K7Z8_9EURY|nr:M28 family peptidase [Halobaculum gomorrense]SHG48821.1 Zn-dependent amino-or carboxypeptidase, M28 family [Halobaculum gomorrense]